VPGASDTSELQARVRARPLPRHVAIIMDGNGRWAQARGLPRVAGHREGAAAVRSVTRAARRLGLEALTLYAFSMQNWSRPADEVEALMLLLVEFLEKEQQELLANAIRLNAIGDLARLPASLSGPDMSSSSTAQSPAATATSPAKGQPPSEVSQMASGSSTTAEMARSKRLRRLPASKGFIRGRPARRPARR